MGVRIVHGADFHLESSFASLPPEKAALRREELKGTFERTIELVFKERAQILLLAGDLFEHDRANRELAHYLNSWFSKLEARVFIAPGNHDPGISNSLYWSYPWSDNVHIFREQIEAVSLADLGCVIYGLGFGHFAIKEPKLSSFKVKDPNMLNLVILHGDDKSNPLASSTSNYLPFSISDLIQGGADYYALGHYHRPKVVWEGKGTVRAYYSGSPEPLGYDEEGEHGVFCGLIDKGGNDLRFIKLNQRAYRTQFIKCNGEQFLEELVGLALNTVNEEERERDFFRLVFTGEVEPNLEIDLQQLENRLQQYFFSCKVQSALLPSYDIAQFDPRTARGMFAAKVRALLEKAVNEEEKEILRQTLTMGLDALNLGKVVER